jgi:autotransporter translocation and assembly factor TamB
MKRPPKLLRGLAYALAFLLVAISALVAVIAVTLDTPWGREQLRRQVNAALALQFQGRLELERVGHVGLSGVRGVDASVYDAAGERVVRARGVAVLASLPGILWQLLANASAPELVIASARVDYVDLTLREDEEAAVTVANAFLPRDGEPEPEPATDTTFRLSMPRIVLGRVWAHGRVQGSPYLDVELVDVAASMSQSTTDGFVLELREAELVTRGLPLGVDPQGRLRGSIDVPADAGAALRLLGTLEGSAAGSPLSLDATWLGDHLHVAVSLPGLPAELVNREAGLALDGSVALVAEAEGELPELDFWVELSGSAGHASAQGSVALSPLLEASAEVSLTGFDAARLVRDAPTSSLSAHARLALFERDESSFVGAYRFEVGAGSVAEQPTPALWSSGELRASEPDGLEASGRLGAAEAGVDLNGTFRVRQPPSAQPSVDVNVRASLEEPPRLAELGVLASGQASVSASLSAGALAGKASLHLRRVDVEPLQARHVEVAATVSGTTEQPRIHAAATLGLLSGRAHADLTYTAERHSVSLFAADLDLVRLTRVLGYSSPVRSGTLGFDARVEGSSRSPRLRVEGEAAVTVGKVLQAKLSLDGIELPRSGLSLAELGKIRGALCATGNVDLAELSPLLTQANVPLERTSGRLRFELSAEQSGRGEGLQVAASVDTNGLRVVGERKAPSELGAGTSTVDAAPLALEGIDLRLALRGNSADGVAVGTLILRDRGGTLAELQGEARIDDLLAGRTPDAEMLARMPVRARLIVGERRLQSLPAMLRPPVLRGRLSLEAELEGTANDPRLAARFRAVGLRTPDLDARLDLDGELRASLHDGEVSLRAKDSRGGALVAELVSRVRGDLRQVAAGTAAATAVTGSAEVKLTDFPLDVVPLLADRQIKGNLSGTIALLDWGRDARLDAKLAASSLTVARVPVSDFRASARTAGDKVLAEVALRTGGGSALASLDAGMRWGARSVPELDGQGTIKLSASGFRLEALSPLVGTSVSEIGGRLDAQTEVRVAPGSTRVAGSASLTEGVLQLPAVGQRFSGITARVSVADDRFELEKLEAFGLTGKVTMTGAARLDGFALRSAEAQLVILEREMLPITLEGAALGDAWGNLKATYDSPEQGTRTLKVNVPSFHLITPESSGKGLQSLEPPSDIRVGVRRADGAFVPLPIQPLEPGGGDAEPRASTPAEPLLVEVTLGPDVSVQRGRTAQAQLTGNMSVLTAPETKVTGRIEVRGGKLDVQGKTFEIERGVVTFDGKDPSNPTITATARWDAPGYTVYADYLGDVQNGRIKLRSEPGLSQDEIASLLLFGSPEGSVGGGSSSNAALAVSVAGDTAAQGLNQVLDDFTSLDVSARVDTTTGSARPELVMRVSPRVTAKVTRAVGTPAVGESPDRTFLTLELRLRRSWALSAILGDRGASALDLIWRRRY